MNMKYILLILLLTACTDKPKPLLKKGDCVQYLYDKVCEKWEKDCEVNTYKIINVGIAHYQVLKYYSSIPHTYFLATETFHYVESMKKRSAG